MKRGCIFICKLFYLLVVGVFDCACLLLSITAGLTNNYFVRYLRARFLLFAGYSGLGTLLRSIWLTMKIALVTNLNYSLVGVPCAYYLARTGVSLCVFGNGMFDLTDCIPGHFGDCRLVIFSIPGGFSDFRIAGYLSLVASCDFHLTIFMVKSAAWRLG